MKSTSATPVSTGKSPAAGDPSPKSACTDVLRAIEDLRSCLTKIEQSGDVPFEVALSLHESLDSLTTSARAMQRNPK